MLYWITAFCYTTTIKYPFNMPNGETKMVEIPLCRQTVRNILLAIEEQHGMSGTLRLAATNAVLPIWEKLNPRTRYCFIRTKLPPDLVALHMQMLQFLD